MRAASLIKVIFTGALKNRWESVHTNTAGCFSGNGTLIPFYFYPATGFTFISHTTYCMKPLPLIVFLFVYPFQRLLAQNDLVPTQGMTSDQHRRFTGRILFTSHPLQQAAGKPTVYLSQLTLTHKTDLFFTAYFSNSLTNYLHLLAPEWPADSLHKYGNYQFTLLLDGQPIYQSQLLPGAPSARNQDTATLLHRPLIDNTNGMGSWSESFWNRFLLHGGDSALTDGKHLLRMEIHPYLHYKGLKTGACMAAGELTLLVQRKIAYDLSSIRLNAVKPYYGFKVSDETFDRPKIKALKAAIEQGVFKRITSLVVIKNGRLLIEEYFNGANRTTLHDTRSVGKSFTSTLTGMAIQDGYLKSEGQTLQAFYPLDSFAHYSPEKGAISIKELLTMSAPFDGNDEDDASPGNEENMYPTENWVQFTLNLPLSTARYGNSWHYFTAGMILLGDILNRSVTGGLEHYAARRLFQPLHIKHYRWSYTPQQVPNTAGGLQLNTLNLAKYGQVYKNGGLWQGRQLIDNDWVEKSLSRQKPITSRNNEYYGYLFWNKTFLVGSKEYEASYCAGNGGNYVLIFKDLPLVIVITATAYGQPYAHPQVTRMLTDYILPAIVH
ncbi:MAG TPA: serine hydrolase [Flavisolibacter sp.]|jgi:CubicO group peptidase (beta-lactamase class C family)|nr:serine hydrolase [Flavisolibacter sp.]